MDNQKFFFPHKGFSQEVNKFVYGYHVRVGERHFIVVDHDVRDEHIGFGIVCTGCIPKFIEVNTGYIGAFTGRVDRSGVPLYGYDFVHIGDELFPYQVLWDNDKSKFVLLRYRSKDDITPLEFLPSSKLVYCNNLKYVNFYRDSEDSED